MGIYNIIRYIRILGIGIFWMNGCVLDQLQKDVNECVSFPLKFIVSVYENDFSKFCEYFDISKIKYKQKLTEEEVERHLFDLFIDLKKELRVDGINDSLKLSFHLVEEKRVTGERIIEVKWEKNKKLILHLQKRKAEWKICNIPRIQVNE
jgi:hypothetical protein